MYQKTVEKEAYSKADLAKAQKLVRDIGQAMKDPAYRKAAKAFYKYHTGEEIKI